MINERVWVYKMGNTWMMFRSRNEARAHRRATRVGSLVRTGSLWQWKRDRWERSR